MPGTRVLVTELLTAQALELLQEEVQVHVATDLTPQQLREVIGDYEGLIVRSETQVTAQVISAARRLNVIGRVGVGLDNIDLEAARRRDIAVVNAPEALSVAVAELTLGLMLALARRIPEADVSLHRGEWARRRLLGTQLHGKALGIIGLGRTGTAVAQRARAFDMEIIAYDPFLSAEQVQDRGAIQVSLTELLQQSDFITLHVPLTAETRDLIGRRELALCKPTAYLIACARGGVVDEEALVMALDEGRIAGAGVDVYSLEPPADSPLLRCPKAILTPRLGASTVEAQRAVAIETARRVLAVLRGGSVPKPAGPALDRTRWTGADWSNPAHLRLRFVGLDQLALHERVDPLRVNRLVSRLRKDGLLRNPPLAAELIPGRRYVILDGATRVQALLELGYDHCPVQIVNYDSPAVGLGRWHHLLMGIDADTFLRQLEHTPGLELEPGEVAEAERSLASRDILCYFKLPDGRLFMARGGGDLEAQAELLTQVTTLYEGQVEVLRDPGRSPESLWVQDDEPGDLAVIFPRFLPSEVTRLALNGARLPMGVTRHIVPGRVLGLGVSLDLLQADVSLQEKNAWLENLLRARLEEKKIRLYQEPVFVVDE